MPSMVEVDEIHEKTADSGVTIKDDLKLSSGNAIKNASGADLLTEAGALGSGVVFPAGHVVQVIQSRIDGTIAIDDVGSYGSLGHSAAITPAAGNKVLVCLNVISHYIDVDRQIHGQVWRDIAGGGYSAVFDAFRYELFASAVVGGMSQMFLDTPPDIDGSDVVTYRVYGKTNLGSQQYHNGSDFPNTLTLMEIVA